MKRKGSSRKRSRKNTGAKRGIIKKFVLDGLFNYIYFVPVVVILNTIPFFLGLPYWNLENILMYSVTSIVISFFFGGIFGRILNVWRKKMNYQ